MKLKRGFWLVLFIVTVSVIHDSLLVYADEVDEAVKSTGYSYKIEYPDNQIDKGGALNLRMLQGQQQQINIIIDNYSEEEIEIELELNGARTNGNGILEYGPSKFQKDKTMVYDLPDLVSIPKSLKVSGASSASFPIDIVMPEKAFDGIVTGGVQLQKIEKATEEEKNPSGQMIINKVAYLFGVTLSMTQNEVLPELELRKVYPELSNYSNAIFFDFSNIKAAKLEELVLDIEIVRKGNKDIKYQKKKASMKMAPNTLMQFPVTLDGEEMIAGKYTAQVKATNGQQNWSWSEVFEITNEEADKFNQADVNLIQERGVNWLMILVIVGVGSFVIVAVYYFSGKKKKEKTSQKRHRRGH